jgi:hypothetical protein
MTYISDYFRQEIFNFISNKLFKDVGFKLYLLSKEDYQPIINNGEELIVYIETRDNKIENYRFELAEDFLSNQIIPLTKECELRGLNFSTEKMRDEVIDDFNSIQMSNLQVENVLNFTKCLIFFIYLCKYIVFNIKLPESIWYSKSKKFPLLSNDFKITPLLAGFFDGCIDEITPIPSALISLYKVYFNNEYGKKLSATYENLEIYRNMLVENKEEFKDVELREHESIKTIISVSFLMNQDEMASKFKQ